MEKAGAPKKKPKGAAQAEAARQRTLDKVLKGRDGIKYADPAAFFNAAQ